MLHSSASQIHAPFATERHGHPPQNTYPDRIPDHLVCYPRLINYRFRHLPDAEFLLLVNKVAHYAEEGLYAIYDYLQIADFYFYFVDQRLVDFTYQQVLGSVRAGLAKAAKRGETNDEAYGNMVHFQKENEETEKFKEEVVTVHLTIIRQRRESLMRRIGRHIREGDIERITQLFNEHRTDHDLFPAAHMYDFCKMIGDAPNSSLSELASIFRERYNAGLCQLLTDDAEPLRTLNGYIDTQLLISYPGLRRFVLSELSTAVKEGLAGVEHAKSNPLRARKQHLPGNSTKEGQE